MRRGGGDDEIVDDKPPKNAGNFVVNTRSNRRAVTLLLHEAINDALDGKYFDVRKLFLCPVCDNVLDSPVSARCGHTFCMTCLQNKGELCTICDSSDVDDVENIAPQRAVKKCAVNVLVKDIVDKWKLFCSSYNYDDISKIKLSNFLGLETRYVLRRRNSGYRKVHNNSIKFENQFVTNIFKKLASPRQHTELRHRRKRSISQYMDLNFERKRIFKYIHAFQNNICRYFYRQIISLTDFDCSLCSRILFEPVTTLCGHTFCRECISRVADHRLACPLCVHPLPKCWEQILSTTHLINEALRYIYPAEYRNRKLLAQREEGFEKRNIHVPVFVCTNAYPTVACPLYVYEPRYKLLARRCLRSKCRRFAMTSRVDNSFSTYGTILEVCDAIKLPDGSSILTTVGIRRFKVIERGETDGYDTARIQYIEDNMVKEENLENLHILHQKVRLKAMKWVKTLSPKLLAEVVNCIGEMPEVERNWYELPDGPSWVWWLMPILPLSSKLQIGFLYTRDLEKRLRAIDKLLDHMKIKMERIDNPLKCPDGGSVDGESASSDTCQLGWII